MKIIKLIFLITIYLITISCDDCTIMYGEEPLGDNFTLVNETEKKAYILYCISEECCRSGFSVIPSNVKSVKFNNRWVIVKSLRNNNELYWIINKKFKIDLKKCDLIPCDSLIKANIYGPYNYEEFIQKRDQFSINLDFDK